MTKPKGKTLLRLGSHRAGDKLRRLFGVEELDGHFTFQHGGIFALVDDAQVADAVKIKGITRARVDWERVFRCW